MNKNYQMRKAQITINNPKEHGYNHDKIKEELAKMKPVIYWIMGDEIGGKENTHHTHIYVVFKTPVRFSTLKNRFPVAHIEKTKGTHSQNADYVKKQGKWKGTEKNTTSIPGTIEEWGELPPDGNGSDERLNILYGYIKSGMSNYEILEESTDYLFDTDRIDRIRLILKQEEHKDTWRNLNVTYIFGKTGAGKSRYVMEKYGYENVFRITDPTHPWDTYKGEDVVVFEEFASTFKIQDMLNYLDGYPMKLPARYSDKIACYTEVFIISNLEFEKQYSNIQKEAPDIYNAFKRRIKKIMHYIDFGKIKVYDSVDEYLKFGISFYKPTPDEEKEIASVFSDEDGEQTALPFE